jgi:hypothetical protein
MTKNKLVGGIMVSVMAVTLVTASANAASTEQVYAKSNAPTATEAFLDKPVVNEAIEKPKHVCKNWLVKELKAVGFRGKNLREAWAIVMRESGGRADAISSTHDYGMFQLNYATWHSQYWWNENKLLTKKYNAQIAYKVSLGGRTWRAWDIDGRGKWKNIWTPRSVYERYLHFYNKYPCK